MALVVVPIYWGSEWNDPRMHPLQPELAINWINVNAAMWTIMRSWYMLGLAEYGVSPGLVHPGYIIQDPADPPPQTFDPESPSDPVLTSPCWTKTNDVIAAGHVPPPETWPNDKVLYTLFFQPGSACSDPNIFGQNDKTHVHTWVTANSDLAGVIETYAHEMVEASSGQEIADPCRRDKIVIDGLRLPKYRSNTLNACWPTVEAILLHRGFLPFEKWGDLKNNPITIGG